MRFPADKTFIVIVVALAPLEHVKIAGAEPLNFFWAAFLPSSIAIVYGRRLAIRLPNRLVPLARAWILFVILTIGIALWQDWHLTFYIPPGTPLVKNPPILTLTRMWKLGIDIATMFLMVTFFARDRKLVRYCARTYLGVGVINAIYALVCFVFCITQVIPCHYEGFFGAYTVLDHTRARGFFVEGGSFGLYLVTVLLVLLVERYVLRDLPRSLFVLCAALLTAALLAAQSKASFCLITALGLWSLYRAPKLRYAIPVGAVALALGAWFVIGNLNDRVMGYVWDYEHLYEESLAEPENGNLVMGRVAAAYVVPAIIADRPLFGIGLGNYPVMRNNPDYSWPLPPAFDWDSGGLGLVDVAAEVGIPLLLFFVVLVLRPVWMATRCSSPHLVVLLAGCQFLAHLFGANIPFVYPYLMTALALGLVLEWSTRESRGTPESNRT